LITPVRHQTDPRWTIVPANCSIAKGSVAITTVEVYFAACCCAFQRTRIVARKQGH